ncbi:MAG: NERD domain-containing protein [Deltaproteobacteria bacterium]|nr:NERD domain-containing protein [Deltaproteobacteria bacterium]
MARVLGEAARYVTGQSLKKYRQQFVILFLVSYCFALVLGFFFGFGFHRHPYYLSIPTFILIVGLGVIALLLVNRITNNLETKRLDFRKGATGEALVGYLLEGLPEDYMVIHGLQLKPQYGDIDHIVVGPSGVYAIDTKNWRGVVKADGKGGLLLNGKPPDKPAIRNLTRAIMNLKDEIKFHATFNPYIYALLVFPAARVEAKWGQTESVHCVRADQLYKYIVENKKGKKLPPKEMDAITQAFLALARMDKDFVSNSK